MKVIIENLCGKKFQHNQKQTNWLGSLLLEEREREREREREKERKRERERDRELQCFASQTHRNDPDELEMKKSKFNALM